MPEDLLKAITEVLLKENENLALIFPVTGLQEFDLWFFRIMRSHVLHRVYNSELSEIAAAGTVDFDYLGETAIGTDDDILEVWEERPFRILHFGIGVMPGEIGIFRSQPGGNPQTGFAYETPTKVTDKFDYVPGHLSPLDLPTVAAETVTYYKSSVHIGLKNDADRAIRPSLRILGKGYDVLPLTETVFVDKMLAGIKPCRYLTVGGLRVFTYTTPDEWKGNQVRVDKATVEKIMATGGR